MNTILFDAHGRLRSGWRFALFLFAFLFLTTLVLQAAFGLIAALGYDPQKHPLAVTIVSASLPLALALLIGWFFGKILEGLPFRALGVSPVGHWLRDLTAGIVLGAAAVVAAVLAGMSLGGLTFELNRSAAAGTMLRGAALSVVVFTIGAAFEEVFLRGYVFQTFVRSGLAWVAVVVTSLLFASGHLGNPEASYFSFANTTLAGVWLGAAYLKTRALWLPFGLHFAWNLVLGTVFGIEVSGLTELSSAPLLREIETGPEWLTGGKYGLEGGAACTIALIASTAAIWFAPFLKADDEMVRLSSPPEGKNENPEL